MVFCVLSVSNNKTLKGQKWGWMTATLQLLPHRLSGYDVCPASTPECIANCNAFSGYAARMPWAFEARKRRTLLLMEDRDIFKLHLRSDLHHLVRTSAKKGFRLAVRLNCFSDIDFRELISSLIEEFPSIVFYDYTKVFSYLQDVPSNYHLTFSWSGKNDEECIKALELGFNVAVPFLGDFPQMFLGHRVIDGERHDLRFLDPVQVIVGLRYKRTKQPNMKGRLVKWVEPRPRFIISRQK